MEDLNPERSYRSGRRTEWRTAAALALVGAAGLALYQTQTRNKVGLRPPDSAPRRVARKDAGRHAHVGRTITINKPRSELYTFWRDFSNLPEVMQDVEEVEVSGDLTRWIIRAPFGRKVKIETRITDDRENELIAWRSTDASDVDTHGVVRFRDAPANRGTEVEAIVAYEPPMGELGRWIAKSFQREPHLQGRRELKRLKMLMETGEIATSANRKSDV